MQIARDQLFGREAEVIRTRAKRCADLDGLNINKASWCENICAGDETTAGVGARSRYIVGGCDIVIGRFSNLIGGCARGDVICSASSCSDIISAISGQA